MLPSWRGYGSQAQAAPYAAYQQPPLLQPQQTAYYPPQQPQIQPQQTGYPSYGAGAPLLHAFQANFLPQAPNVSSAPLPVYFQQQNMAQAGQPQVQVQWALTPDERKSYGQIFRQWADGNGSISGTRAQQVFRDSGLDREDLMKIWALADIEDRGRLNLAEFEVAMGLIYRKLSGNPIPGILPEEMVPPSSRDLDTSVDFLKDLLRNDTHSRSTNLDAYQSGNQSNKYAKVRSFNRNASPEPSSATSRKDAAVYKHDDGDVKTYKSSSRHLDRRNVRFHGDDDDASDLGSLKKQLKDTQDLLDRTYKVDSDNDDVNAEIEDLKYRIRRVQEDIEFNKSGRRTEGKDNERRRLERELLFLMHDKLPELEEKIRERDRKKRYDDKSAARSRDQRNQRTIYDSRENSDRGRGLSRYSDEDDEKEDRGYLRGSYSASSFRKPERSPDSFTNPERKTPEEKITRNESNDVRAPPSPPPPRVSATESPRSPPPPPSGTKAPATQTSTGTSTPTIEHKKPQSAEERQAYIRAEAQRRVQERMRMLTGQSPSSTPAPSEPLVSGYDSSLQARLEQDKREAAKRAEDDDKAASERERLRQIKLEEERQKKLAAEQSILRDSANALHQVADEVTASEMKHPEDSQGIATSAAHDELAREERLNREREQYLSAQQQESQARVQQLKSSIGQRPKAAPPPPTPRGHKAPPKPPPSRKNVPSSLESAEPVVASPIKANQQIIPPSTSDTVNAPQNQTNVPPPPPPPPVAPASEANNTPAAASPSATVKSTATPPTKSLSSTNPFHRLGASASTSTPSINDGPKGANNPFFRPPTGASTSLANQDVTPSVRPAVPPHAASTEEDWGDVHDLQQADSDDSDDEENSNVKQMRAGLAGLLFGGTSTPTSNPPSRPASTRPEGRVPQPPPAAPLPPLGAAAGAPPPRAALLGAIQGGAKLRKATTVDKSAPLGAGHVLSIDAAANAGSSAHSIPNSPSPSSESKPRQEDNDGSYVTSPDKHSSANRQSVDWYGGLAADRYPSPTLPVQVDTTLPLLEEADEPPLRKDPSGDDAPQTTSGNPGVSDKTLDGDTDDPDAYFDMTSSTKVRSLYSYEGQRDQDATFSANLLIIAHPAKDRESDWLYGIVPATGSRGWLPKTYVEELAFNIPAKVLYDFEATTEDELEVSAGTSLFVCEKVDADWVRAVVNGRIGLVPAAYLQEENRNVSTLDNLSSEAQQGVESRKTMTQIAKTQIAGVTDDPVENAQEITDDDDSDEDDSDEESAETREVERLRVLQAAGLKIQNHLTRGTQKRRPPPPLPRLPTSYLNGLSHKGRTSPATASKDAAASTNGEMQGVVPTDDAYARWQALKGESSALARTASAGAASGVEIAGTKDGGGFVENTSPDLHAEAAATFSAGQTWSSLIDKEVLSTIPDKARKRQEAIFELIKTEETFLNSVQTVVKEWFAQLQPLLDQKECDVIFANIEDIMIWSATFFSDLESRQKECRLYIDRIGDIAKQYSASLDVYRPYCLNQGNAMQLLETCRTRSEDVDRVASTRLHGLTLSHFLLEPFQILRYTEDDDPDIKDLKLAVRNAQLVLSRTNEHLKMQESDAKLAYLSEHLAFPDDQTVGLDLTAPTRYGQPRLLIKEGELLKGYSHRRPSKRKMLHAYLFTDLLLLTSQAMGLRERFSNMSLGQVPDAIFVYKTPLPIDELSVHTSSDNDKVVVIEYKTFTLKLQTSTSQQCVEWVRILHEVRSRFERSAISSG